LERVPGTLDLETAAQVLKVLRGRGISPFTGSDYKVAGLARVADGGDGILHFLAACGLLASTSAGWVLSKEGEDVVDGLVRGEWGRYAFALIGSGFYDDEILRLVEAADDVGDALRCPLSSLSQLAPLVGRIFAWEGSFRQDSDLVLPAAVIDAFLVQSGMGQAEGPPDWVLEQDAVGWRAEQYSLRHERSTHGAKQVRHVSRDAGDGFGYDVEVAASQTPRLVEVKGSRSPRLAFFITRRELETAEHNVDSYELHFWGRIDLSRPPGDEYSALRSLNYPVVITKVAETITGEGWIKQPQSWRVERR
jgi:Domain of unknown function (DUF3883)